MGFDPVKVNVVLMRGVNDDEMLDFVALTRDDAIKGEAYDSPRLCRLDKAAMALIDVVRQPREPASRDQGDVRRVWYRRRRRVLSLAQPPRRRTPLLRA